MGKTLVLLFVPILLGLLLFFSVNTCQRFEPEGFLHITTDTVEALSGGNYQLIGTVVEMGDDRIEQHGYCWS